MMPDDSGQHSSDGDFNPFQSSQLFFSICFAIPVGGVFLLVSDALAKEKLSNLACAFFGLTIIFLVWRQFSSYYIPLQFYRREPETLVEESTTFLVTVVLSGIILVSPSHPEGVLPLTLILLFLNLRKVQEMNRILRSLAHPPEKAIKELKRFAQHTCFYIGAGAVQFLLEVLFAPHLPRNIHVLLVGTVPLVVYVLAALLRRLWQSNTGTPPLSWNEYDEDLRLAFLNRGNLVGEQ